MKPDPARAAQANNITAPTAEAIARAVGLLRRGDVIGLPTETVYGLAGDGLNPDALARIFEVKQRPLFDPLILHFSDAETAFAFVEGPLPPPARQLAAKFWPGPLTLVLPKDPGSDVALLTGAGLDTLAVRVPAHPAALALLRATGRPVAAPSANCSGQVSPTKAQHVLDGLDGRIAAVLDCGPCMVGVESTVLDLAAERPTLLRPGGITLEDLQTVVGPVASPGAGMAAAVRSPGMLASHYAPRAKLRLDARQVGPDEVLLAFGPTSPEAGTIFQLSARGDLTEAAANLFAGLRALDATGCAAIAVMPIPHHGLGSAINDRLRRAAAPR
jgi:L-threonylcarbamoyladenylate synthase